jgi:diaminohydroxyphosphoribosylaminopyrimidine deaminase/5-amino-6-(5-phosphoribosylamino)uracil reductase
MTAKAFSPVDESTMRDALALAQLAIGLSDPNPRVGCVLIGANGQRAEGHTQAVGEAHAEVMALRSAAAAGWNPTGATAYVTLEPCAHHGRTPPCCDALIEAGVSRVVIAAQDPNPLVAGQGAQRLRQSGITVDSGLLADESRELNIGFFSRMLRQRPWVRLKIAASLDGRTALENGQSQWITGEAARIDGHAWRRRAGAVLTGIGTVLDDDPRLDVRLVPSVRQPLRVVLDPQLRLPLNARILDEPSTALVYAAAADEQRVAALTERGVEVALRPGSDGRVDLPSVLSDLALRGINELHVEAGATLNGAWLRQGLVDELLLYLAPLLIGPGRGLASWPALQDLAEASRFEFGPAEALGTDLRLQARPLARASF